MQQHATSRPRSTALWIALLALGLAAPPATRAQDSGGFRCFDGETPGIDCSATGFCGGGLCVDTSPPPACDGCPAIVVGSLTTAPGGDATLTVILRTSGRTVVGVQNDLRFDAHTPIIACQTNPELSNGFSGFHIGQTAMRAVIAGLDDIPIPDGALLYACTVAVSGDATAGTYPLQISNTIGSDPNGNRLDLSGQDGAVVVAPSDGGTPVPTRTPLPTPTPTVAIPPDLAVTLSVSTVSGHPGDDVRFDVSYASTGPGIVSLQNDVVLAASTYIVADAAGRPDCQLNPDLAAREAIFVFPAVSCATEPDCPTVRAQIFKADFDPAGMVLYTCTLHVAAGAVPGRYPLLIQNASTSTPDGLPFPVVPVDGELVVSAADADNTGSVSSQSGGGASLSATSNDGCTLLPGTALRNRRASQIILFGLLGLAVGRHVRRRRR